jgi:iron complex transport system ATP-binding protein
MSSGEAKRTLIARALVHDPRTLLFDESSNALDIAAQLQLRDTMRQLARMD